MTASLPARASTFWGPVLGADRPDRIGDDHEVLVIGAGITGMTTAMLLARRGIDVAVVDAARPGAGTTARSTAKASLLHATVSGQIRRKHGQDAVNDYIAANLAGQQVIRDVIDETSLVDAQVRDAWTYATTSKSAISVEQEAEALAAAGLPAELATPTELPYETTAAVRLPDQLQINPAQYLSALYGELVSLNVPVVWPQRVAVIDSNHDHLLATTTRGRTMKAKWIIVATLLPFPLRTMTFANTSATRSYVLAARVNGPLPQGMYISADYPSHSLRTALSASGEEILLAGGYGHHVGHSNPTSDHVQDLADWTSETFAVREFSHRWSAQDYVSAHMLPQVGPSPLGPKGLLIATGFGKWGITNGSAAAVALTDHICGSEPQWAPQLKPRAAGLAKIAQQNLRVGFTLAKGWLVEPLQHREVKPGLPTPKAVAEVQGTTYECSAVCTHLGGIVRYNDAESSWDCPLHGSRFGPDGAVLEGPAVTALNGHGEEGVSSQATSEAT